MCVFFFSPGIGPGIRVAVVCCCCCCCWLLWSAVAVKRVAIVVIPFVDSVAVCYFPALHATVVVIIYVVLVVVYIV